MKDNTKNGVMRITSVPTGHAPIELRKKWIGVEVPLLEVGIPTGLGRSALDSRKTIKPFRGFIVDQVEALTALRRKSPEAADWWQEMGFPIKGAQFLFNVGCGEVIY